MENRLKGLTLVEFLVVIFIIACIAALTPAALTGARDDSKQALCAGKMRQIGSAVNLYAEDFKDWMPPAYQSAVQHRYLDSWIWLIAPYLELPAGEKGWQPQSPGHVNPWDYYYEMGDFYSCPADDEPLRLNPGATGWRPFTLSYGYNPTFGHRYLYEAGPNAGCPCYSHKTREAVRARPGAFVVSEVPADRINANNCGPINNFREYSGTGLMGRHTNAFYHEERKNVLSMDGSVKSTAFRDGDVYWSPGVHTVR